MGTSTIVARTATATTAASPRRRARARARVGRWATLASRVLALAVGVVACLVSWPLAVAVLLVVLVVRRAARGR